MIDVIDALLTVESDATIAIDRSGQRPAEFRPETLYAWIETNARRIAAGLQDREDFTALVVFVGDNEGEEAQQVRGSAVTDRLVAKRDAYLSWIRDHEATPTWDHVEGDSDMDFVRTFEGRAVAVRVDGYRYVA